MTTVKLFRDYTRNLAVLFYHINDGVHYFITVRWRNSRAECVSIRRLEVYERHGEPTLRLVNKRTVLGRRLAKLGRTHGDVKLRRELCLR